MGFKELECFNKVLLSKEGWCRVRQPDSLVAQIIKEKYYPQENLIQFLELGLWNKFSYARRSIWQAKDLLKAGLVWHVERQMAFEPAFFYGVMASSKVGEGGTSHGSY